MKKKLLKTDLVYRLTDVERTAMGIGLKDTEENRVYSSEAADNMIKQWLSQPFQPYPTLKK